MEFYFSHCPYGEFSMAAVDKLQWLPVTLPGDSIQHLLDAEIEKCMPEYFDNSQQFFKYEAMDFIYRTRFDGETDAHYRFSCDGLDTIADIYLNGVKIYESRTAFVRLDFPLDAVTDGENELLVHFISPTEFIKSKRPDFDKKSMNVLFDEKWRAYLRKPQWHYGWDNAPHLAGVGFIGTPRLFLITAPLHISSMIFDQEYDWQRRSADFKFRVDSTVYRECLVKLRLQFAGRTVWESQNCSFECGKYELQPLLGGHLDDIKAWNCVGYGDPNLYNLQLLCGSEVIYQTEIGFRNIELSRRVIGKRSLDFRVGHPEEQEGLSMDGSAEAAEEGKGVSFNGAWSHIPVEPYEVEVEDFCLVLNGTRVFIEGFDWQSLEYNLSNVDSEKLADTLEKMAELKVNSVRIWGGAYIEDAAFYHFCDRHGIIVWQDFQFACSLYPDRDRYFRALVRQEVTDIFKRLANHASLGIFCGSNEIDMVLHDRGLDCRQGNTIGYELIPAVLHDLQCPVPYHVSSPSGSEYPRFPFSGECRNWSTMTHIADDYSALRADESIMVSEGGCAAYPGRELCEQFIRPEWPLHEDFLLEQEAYRIHAMNTYFHQHRSKPQNIHQAIRKYFGQWHNLDELIYLSQLYQAEGLQRYVEVFRYKAQTMHGYYIWKFADTWPCISLSVMDYHGRPKMAWYVLKRAMGDLTVCPSFDDRYYTFSIFSRYAECAILLTVKICDLQGRVLQQKQEDIAVLSAGINHNNIAISRTDFGRCKASEVVMYAAVTRGEEIIHERLYFPVPLAQLPLVASEIHSELSCIETENGICRYALKLTVQALTISTNITSNQQGCTLFDFSDNCFSMLPNTTKIIYFSSSCKLDISNLTITHYKSGK